MKINVRVANYRCFPVHCPAEFELGDGVTAFVGENNAGKSASLRMLHDLRGVLRGMTPEDINGLLRSPSGRSLGSEVRDPLEVFFNGNPGSLQLTIAVEQAEEQFHPRPPAMTSIQLTLDRETGWRVAWPQLEGLCLVDASFNLYRERELGKLIGDAKPIVAALRALANALYIPVNRHLGPGGKTSFGIPLGNDLVDKWNTHRDGTVKAHNALADRVERSVAEIFGVPYVRVVASSEAGRKGIQFTFGEAGQFRSDEVGSGIAQVFTALMAAAISGPSFILIDEPELSLHPVLQMRFVRELQRYAGIGVAYSTHNLGLAMNAAERVYAVSRQPGNKQTNGRPWSRMDRFERAPELSAIMGSLSFPSYSDLAVRRVLLVEGLSDLRIVEILLERLGVADQVVPIHMGGSATLSELPGAREQLMGVKRLCNKVSCLVDSESTKEGCPDPRRMKFVGLCKELDINVHCTKSRATENYLSESACKAEFGPKARALEPFERLEDANPGWSKKNAWRAVCHMEVEDFGDVGTFLTELAQEVQRDRERMSART